MPEPSLLYWSTGSAAGAVRLTDRRRYVPGSSCALDGTVLSTFTLAIADEVVELPARSVTTTRTEEMPSVIAVVFQLLVPPVRAAQVASSVHSRLPSRCVA